MANISFPLGCKKAWKEKVHFKRKGRNIQSVVWKSMGVRATLDCIFFSFSLQFHFYRYPLTIYISTFHANPFYLHGFTYNTNNGKFGKSSIKTYMLSEGNHFFGIMTDQQIRFRPLSITQAQLVQHSLCTRSLFLLAGSAGIFPFQN